MTEQISQAIEEKVDVYSPYNVIEKIEELSALMSNAALHAAKAKQHFDVCRKLLHDDGVVKKSDTSSHVESLLSGEAFDRDYTASLKQALQIRITALQSILSYLKSERDAQR